MQTKFDHNFNSFLFIVDDLKKVDEEKAQVTKHFLNKLKSFEKSFCLEDKEIQEILKCFESIQKNLLSLTKSKGKTNEFLYSLADTFFSYPSLPSQTNCSASKENIQKLLSFVYEKCLKPYVLEN